MPDQSTDGELFCKINGRKIVNIREMTNKQESAAANSACQESLNPQNFIGINLKWLT